MSLKFSKINFYILILTLATNNSYSEDAPLQNKIDQFFEKKEHEINQFFEKQRKKFKDKAEEIRKCRLQRNDNSRCKTLQLSIIPSDQPFLSPVKQGTVKIGWTDEFPVWREKDQIDVRVENRHYSVSVQVNNAYKLLDETQEKIIKTMKSLKSCIINAKKNDSEIEECNQLREDLNFILPEDRGRIYNDHPGRISENDVKKLFTSK